MSITKTLRLRYRTGQTGLTAEVRSLDGSTVIATGLAFAETAAGSRTYLATFTDAVSRATYFVIVSKSGTARADFLVDLAEVDAVYDLVDAPSLEQIRGGLATSDDLTAAITATTIVRIRGPVFAEDDGTITTTLTVGDDYSATDGQAIDLDFDGTTLPDLTNAIAEFVCVISNPKTKTVTFTGSLTVPTGGVRTVRFTPTSDETAELRPTAEGEWYVAFTLTSGRRITPIGLRGSLIVLPSLLAEC